MFKILLELLSHLFTSLYLILQKRTNFSKSSSPDSKYNTCCFLKTTTAKINLSENGSETRRMLFLTQHSIWILLINGGSLQDHLGSGLLHLGLHHLQYIIFSFTVLIFITLTAETTRWSFAPGNTCSSGKETSFAYILMTLTSNSQIPKPVCNVR